MNRLRFGIFMAPFHSPVGQDPTSAYERDLDVLRLVDKLGYDEAWIGEHHSAGHELVPDPMIFIAHAANHTRHIKLGTGVVSLPYHNPLWVADRALFLDHLTRGRFMLGVGPGALPTDAAMINLRPEDQRGALEQDTDVLCALLRGETVSVETPRYRLVDARTQFAPYSDFDIAVTAIASPTGPRAAGKNGTGLLSVGATLQSGFDVLGLHWDVLAERAREFGHVPDRSAWRLVGPMHIAETREQAIEDVKFRRVERVEWVNESGLGVIGTPDDAIRQIDRLVQQSGGFGAYLFMHTEWARPDAMARHYELFARYVKPHFQGTTERLQRAEDYAKARWQELDARSSAAITEATERHAKEQAAKL